MEHTSSKSAAADSKPGAAATPTALEDVLRDLPAHGRVMRDGVDCQMWQFEHQGRPYHLKHYWRSAGWERVRRWVAGNPALREFSRLQLLQKARVTAPRAVAILMGYKLDGRQGDALIVEAMDGAVRLDEWVRGLSRGVAVADTHAHASVGMAPSPQPSPGVLGEGARRRVVQQIIEILQKMAKAGLGHRDMRMGSFWLKDGRVYLAEAAGVHRSGLSLDDLLVLEASAFPCATRTEKQRVWNALGPGGRMPARNRRGPACWTAAIRRAMRAGDCFVQLADGDWEGLAFKQAEYARPWSELSGLKLTEEECRKAWGGIVGRMEEGRDEETKRRREEGGVARDEGGQMRLLKQSDSGEVFEMDLRLGDKDAQVVVKIPRVKNWRRRFSQWLLGPRVWRAWLKAWELVARDIPTAWPLLVMRDGRGSGVLVMEKVRGRVLAEVRPDDPQMAEILWRCGRLLRRLEQTCLYLYDAKAANWIIRDDPAAGPTPVIIDTDSIRRIRQPGGLRRLMRSLRELHGERFTEELAMALARGYRPAGDRKTLGKLTGGGR
jgi:hypothetical protein